MIPDLPIQYEENLGFVISIKPKFVKKYWCWAYSSEEIASFVKSKIIERWINCPVQKFEDYTNVFVTSIELVTATSIKQLEIEIDWISEGVNIKQISGK